MATSKKRADASQMHKGLPILLFSSVDKWRAWLARSHESSGGLWVRLAKKGASTSSISYIEARDQAIAYGWIDGLKNAIDEEFYAVRFTPRRKRSVWSKINREVSERLILAGEMTPAGLREVEAARADGRWENAYAGSATMEIHPELEGALAKSPAAKKFFATISAKSRFAILYRVHEAKRPETRERRIKMFIEMLLRGEVPP
jgi:uncharacterized protein YdeI (YjbR/CyaY-like superfamily)